MEDGDQIDSGLQPLFIKRAECSEPGYEYEWDRVQRERKEGHPKYLGKFFRLVTIRKMTSLEYARDMYVRTGIR